MWLRHRHHLALLLLLLSCCGCLIAPVTCRSRDKEGRRRNDRLSATSSTSFSSAASASSYYSSSASTGLSSSSSYLGPIDTTGFCTRRRDMKLMCYCTPDENHTPVQKAECWVFADGLLQNDTTWTRFFKQTRIRDLKFVIQNHGRLDYIPTMVLEPLKNLTSITIEYSQVEVVKSNAFANLAYLDKIILTNNQIVALDQEAFANHVKLRELNLEHNQIYEIDRYAFRNLPLCERLWLNNNNISNLHDSLFVEMARLEHLNLAYNQISVLTSDIFKGLGNLNELKLSHNNLNFIGDTVFAELWSLVKLELDDNRIERISERALDGLNNLKTLNLRNNMLKKIDNGLLRGTPALLFINVQSNELETLTFYTFQPIMDNLVNSTSELLVSDNNFVCDCRLQWIFDLRNRTHYQKLRDSLEEFVCTLQEPKIAHFVEPVPNHILDLLNIGAGYSGSITSHNSAELHTVATGTNSGRKRLSKSGRGQGGTQGQRSARLDKSGQMQLAEHVATLRKRSLAVKQFNSELDSHQAEAMNSAYAEKPYYDDSVHGPLAHHQVELEDGLDALKQNALYNQHNEVLLSGNTITEHAATKQPLGIKVRLFTLKPENLPCHDELSDPTELPLSRDLMDVRSNIQSIAASKAIASRGESLGVLSLLGLMCSLVLGEAHRRFELRVG